MVLSREKKHGLRGLGFGVVSFSPSSMLLSREKNMGLGFRIPQ